MRFTLYSALLGLLLALVVASTARGSSQVIYGVNDAHFNGDWTTMAEQIAPLELDQVAVWVNYDRPLAWEVPLFQPVTVMLVGGTPPVTPRSRRSYVAFARRLVREHPNIRAIQVWNEIDLHPPGYGFSDVPAYLNLLAGVHDALRGTGVKTLAFGYSPVKFDPHGTALEVQRWYKARHWKRPIMDGLAYHPYWCWDSGFSQRIARALDQAWRGLPQPSPKRGLRFWWTETGMWSSGTPWRQMVGTPEQQAERVAEVARAAYADPLVAADFNYLLGDETAANRWTSGLYFADGTAKPAFFSFRDAIRSG